MPAMPTEAICNTQVVETPLNEADISSLQPGTGIYQQLPPATAASICSHSITRGSTDAFILSTNKCELGESQLFKLAARLQDDLNTRDLYQHVHNLKGTCLDSFCQDFHTHVLNNLTRAQGVVLLGCDTLTEFGRRLNNAPNHIRPQMIAAADSYEPCAEGKLPKGFWRDAAAVYASNQQRNLEEHGSVLASADFVIDFVAEADPAKPLPGSATLLGMAWFAKENHKDLEEQRQQELAAAQERQTAVRAAARRSRGQ